MTRDIGFLIFPQFQLLDAAGPIAAFEIAGRFVPGAYRLRVLAREPGAVASSSGVAMTAEAFADAPPLDTLIVSGGEGTRSPAICEATLAFARDTFRTAQQLVVYHRRPGGQSQFSALLEMNGGRFDALLAWARENLALPLSVDQLAQQAAMSPRNFARLFAAETGNTPAKAIERLRVEAARALLDSQPLQVEDVALETGFGDQERMRRAFVRAFGQPPQALRRAARASQPHVAPAP